MINMVNSLPVNFHFGVTVEIDLRNMTCTNFVFIVFGSSLISLSSATNKTIADGTHFDGSQGQYNYHDID